MITTILNSPLFIQVIKGAKMAYAGHCTMRAANPEYRRKTDELFSHVLAEGIDFAKHLATRAFQACKAAVTRFFNWFDRTFGSKPDNVIQFYPGDDDGSLAVA